MEPVRVYFGLGSNLGDRLANLEWGLQILGERVRLVKVSSIYETEPCGVVEQPAFLNCVVEGFSTVSPGGVLQIIKETERMVGRWTTFPGGPRVFDADLLFYGDRTVDLPHLKVPHPRIPERAFVLVPMAEIAADLLHPTLEVTVETLTARVQGRAGVRWYGRPPELPGTMG